MVLDIVIMAAGKGTRMKSARPKVLHRLAGKSLLQHVLHTAAALVADRTVVITGHGAEAVEAEVASVAPTAVCVRQMPQLGTGHAVQQAAPALHASGVTLILNGDVPLTRVETVRALLAACAGERLALLTLTLPDATGYGRILRDDDGGGAGDGTGADNRVLGIVEHKDATPEQRAINLINSGIYAFDRAHLFRCLKQVKPSNAQGEYYLTDVVAMLVNEERPVELVVTDDVASVLGVNTPADLAQAEQLYPKRLAAQR